MKNWIDPHHLFVVQPRTPEEVDMLADDIKALASLFPFYEIDSSFYESDSGMRLFPQAFTLIYHKDKPVAYIEITDSSSHALGKDSMEFGGVVLPDYRDKGLTQQVAPAIIRQAFRRTGKKKMLAFVPKDHAEARHAIAALGFKYFGDQDGISRYKLDRTDALA